jgi:poly(hydroxyalkanoate) depolymerase family esterase
MVNLAAMQKALSLVRSGRLGEATSLIQRSLVDKTTGQVDWAKNSKYQHAHHEGVADIAFKDLPSKVPRDVPNPSGTVIEAKPATNRSELSYRFFIPARLDRAAPAPLLVMLHGCKQNASDFAVGTQMDSIAEKAGCFVLYPQQSIVANPGGCWNWFKQTHQSRDRGEPKLIADLIANLVATHNIDASRVYVAGLSAGGAMAAIMAEQYSEMFTALGVHSGLPTGVARNLPEAMNLMRGVSSDEPLKRLKVPTIVFHGESDTIVAPINAQYFSDAMSINPTTHIETLQGIEGRPFTRKIYRSKSGDHIGEYWSIKGAGHAWSGGTPSGSYTDAKGPNASAEMMRFFLECSNKNK